VQLDLHTQIILSVLSVYQSANKGKCNNDTGWKFKITTFSLFIQMSVLCVGKLGGQSQFEDFDVDGGDEINWLLNSYDRKSWTRLIGLRTVTSSLLRCGLCPTFCDAWA
jgi:hypothetical protein